MEKPILFSTPMVQEILDGRKTMTRRIVDVDISNQFDVDVDGTVIAYMDPATGDSYNPTALCKYKVGDILWVRETWCKLWHLDNNDQIIEGTESYYYRADGYNPTPFNHFPDEDGFGGERDCPRWKPSIHMPRAAARLFIRVTDIRVGRLHDISEDDVMAEGIRSLTKDGALYKYGHIEPGDDGSIPWRDMPRTAKEAFTSLWNSTIWKSDLYRYGWQANPWVWVIEFERMEGYTNVS